MCRPRPVRLAAQVHGSSDHALLAQPADLCVAQLEYLAQHLIGVFAEDRRGPRRLTRGGRELQRRSRHQVTADARLFDHGEHRVPRRAARVVLDQLQERLVGAPAYAGAGEGQPNLIERARGEPRSQHRRDRLPGLEALAFLAQVDTEQLFDERELVGQPGDLAERVPLPPGERDDVDVAFVPGGELAAIGAVEVVAEGLRLLAVDLRAGDVAEVAHHRHRDVGKRQLDVLAGAGKPTVTFRCNDAERRGQAGDRVPRRQQVVDRIDRLVAVGRTGDERKADRGIHRVVERRSTVRVAEDVEHDQVVAAAAQVFVAEPAGRRKVGDENAAGFTLCGDEIDGERLARGAASVDRDRAFALVQSCPVEAFAVAAERPTARVQSALERIEANHLRAELRQRHAAQGRGDERRTFDDAQTGEYVVQVAS